jgi:ubiquinone biosynthesis protein UbiJ
MKHDLAGQVATARAHAERLLEGSPGVPGAAEWRELRANVAAAEARVAALRAKIARTAEEAARSELG